MNTRPLGSVFTGDSGSFVFTLLTAPETDEGLYTVRVGVTRPLMAMFELDGAEPERPVEGEYTAFEVPDGVAYATRVYLPLVVRELE